MGKSLLLEDNLRRTLDLELENLGLGPGSHSSSVMVSQPLCLSFSVSQILA